MKTTSTRQARTSLFRRVASAEPARTEESKPSPGQTLAPPEQVEPLFSASQWSEKLPAGTSAPDVVLGGDRTLALSRLALMRAPDARQDIEAAVERMAKTSDAERLRHLPFMMTTHRKEYVQDMLAVMRARSSALKRAIGQGERSQWDVVVVGAGVHGTTLAADLRGTELQVLVVEKSDLVAPTFARGGDRFRLSTPSRFDDGRPATRRRGNANHIGGIIQTSDLSEARYPEGEVLAHAATVNLFASGADVLFGSSVNDFGAGEQLSYRVGLDDGTSVETQRLVFAAGLGDDVTNPVTGVGRGTIERELAAFPEVLSGQRPPRVLTATQALELAGATRDGLAPYRGKQLALLGTEAPAKQLVEFIQGISSDSAYHDSVAQLGDVGGTTWFTGKNGFTDCPSFLKQDQVPRRGQERGRFASLTAAFKNKIQAQASLPVATYTVDPSTSILVNVRGGGLFEAEVTILATPPRAPELPISQDDPLETKTARVQGLLPTPVGLRLSGEKVYFIGQTARMLAGRARGAGALGTDTLLATIPRTEALARNLAAKVTPRAARPGSPAPEPLRPVSGRDAGEPVTWEIAVESVAKPLPASAERDIEKGLGRLLDRVRVRGPNTPALTLTFRKSPNEALSVTAEGLAPEAVEDLSARISSAERLPSLLAGFVANTPFWEYTLKYPLFATPDGRRPGLPTRTY